jgi:hypothetical protein
VGWSGYACTIEEGTMKASDYVHILSTTLMDSRNYYATSRRLSIFSKITILSTDRSLLVLGLKKLGLKKSTPSVGLLKVLI